MPYNPGGIFSLVASYFATPGQTIRTEQHNPPLEDIASALSNVLVRDGRAAMTGPLNMNGQVINNVGVGTASTSVATLAQAVPIGGGIDFWGDTAPALWQFAYGQVLSQTAFAELYAVFGAKYNTGAEGAGNFRMPDKRGRGSISKDNMGGVPAGRVTTAGSGVDGTTLGAGGGAQTVPILMENLPATPAPVVATATNPNTVLGVPNGALGSQSTSTGGNRVLSVDDLSGIPNFPVTSNTANLGNGVHLNKLPPGIVCNYIIYAGA